MKRLFTLVAGAGLVFALGCGGNSAVPTAPTNPTTDLNAIVSLKIEGVPSTLTVGDSYQLKVVATLAAGTTLDVTARAAFKTSNAAVATISANGVLSLHAPGDCGLSALVDSISVSVDARVKAKESIVRLDIRGKRELLAGEQSELKVIAVSDTGAETDVTARAIVSSSDEQVLKIIRVGIIEGVNPGSCDLLAILDGIRVSVRLNVGKREASILRIRIDGLVTLKVGQTSQLKAIAVLNDNTEVDVTAKIKWATSDSQCCLVNLIGVLTALLPGNCTLTGTLDGITVNVPVKVTLL
jgi:hypothetical protein